MSVLNNSNAIESGGYNIDRSLRFRSTASAYLNRTPASAGNQQKFTWSGWVKRGQLASVQRFLSAGAGGGDAKFGFLSGDTLQFQDDNTGANVITTQVFRDPSAWYHIIYSIDSTQATAANRILLYINGVNVTAFSTATYMTQNANSYFNSANAHYIGRRYSGGEHFDGYLAEVNFIDGQALTPSSFGQTDATTGSWVPKKYTGTYGTNGFYLPFTNTTSATTLAYDKSGNGNNWTANNISTTAGATYDSMTDVPTLTSATAANYCVLNPLVAGTGATITGGNLNAVGTAATFANARSTFTLTSGKWYWEETITGSSIYDIGVGLVSEASIKTASNTRQAGWYNIVNAGPSQVSSTTNGGAFVTISTIDFATNDVLMTAYDADTGYIWFGKNGTWYPPTTGGSAGNPSAGTNQTITAVSGLIPSSFHYNTNSGTAANFGQRPFSYTPPTGFKALNTYNLPDPTIKKPNQYMDATTYTGNGSTQLITNAGSFQPDFVWLKRRDGSGQDHVLQDSVRGFGSATKLASSSTAAENNTGGGVTDPQWGYVSSAATNGFNLNVGVTGDQANKSTWSYVGWQWKESAAAGFDIVTYTGTGVARTVSHSLGVAPAMMIVKSRSIVQDWPVYHKNSNATPQNYTLYLDLTNAAVADSNMWNNTAPTSSVFTVGTSGSTNQNSATYVAYLFAEIAGFSKFGSYTGNGSTDGPFVYCGFRPRWIMAKRSDSGAYDWFEFDTARETYNNMFTHLKPNANNAEDTGVNPFIDVISNGFKLRTANNMANASGGTYIYAAFAESPFKTSNAR